MCLVPARPAPLRIEKGPEILDRYVSVPSNRCQMTDFLGAILLVNDVSVKYNKRR
jgi:hypothetical protein